MNTELTPRVRPGREASLFVEMGPIEAINWAFRSLKKDSDFLFLNFWNE